MSEFKIYVDKENMREKKVLNTLTMEEREKISRFLRGKMFFCSSYLRTPSKKEVYFYVRGDYYDSANKLFKSLRSITRYFLSREKVNNIREFNFDFCYLNRNDEPSVLLKEVSSSAFFTRVDNQTLKNFSCFALSEKVIIFIIFFKNGNFLEEEPSAGINKGKPFISENCVTCLENKPGFVFLDCGHICECRECFNRRKSAVCPICRTKNRALGKL